MGWKGGPHGHGCCFIAIVIFVTSARPMGDDPVYDRNQLFAKQSWERLATAIVYLNDPQPALASPKTRFFPSEPYPRVSDMVNLCADQEDWCVILNSDIWLAPNFKSVADKLKAKRAVAASSWRWNFDPAAGIEPCVQDDAGLDFFAAQSGAWDQVHRAMLAQSPRGEEDSPAHLRFGAPRWDSWMLGTFNVLFANLGFYNLTDTRCVRHPRHEGRKYGPAMMPHFLGWPIMGASFL